MTIKVELKPGQGKNHADETVYFNRWDVFVDGRLGGYLDFTEGSTLCLIRFYSEDDGEEIAKQCEKLRKPPGPVKRSRQLQTVEMLREKIKAAESASKDEDEDEEDEEDE